VLTNIHVSWLDPKKVRQMTVVGNQQMATWDDLQMASPIAIYDREPAPFKITEISGNTCTCRCGMGTYVCRKYL
jgi:hypothetical protein